MTTITHEQFISTLTERFGDSPADWAFVCPSCGDVATGNDFKTALAEHPRAARDGEPFTADRLMGQECIGRTLGALTIAREVWDARRAAGEVRGCDWVAFGFIPGPLQVELPDHRVVRSFEIAPAPAPAGPTSITLPVTDEQITQTRTLIADALHAGRHEMGVSAEESALLLALEDNVRGWTYTTRLRAFLTDLVKDPS